ncbi:MAG TPA: hypothetical protein VM695_00370 [Phycisphaerae bacterium]|nr:hypothetical protein [Phycisphaerae bacterium]
MKQTPEERRVLERMAPGVLCREGFLGEDPRPLQEILDTDGARVEALGATHEEIARHLREAYEDAAMGFGNEVPVAGGRLRAVWHEAMGFIPSPWGDGARFPKGEVELTDPRTARALRYTPLSVHMIARYGFYQGRGSRYRVEPDQVVAFFGLDRRGE